METPYAKNAHCPKAPHVIFSKYRYHLQGFKPHLSVFFAHLVEGFGGSFNSIDDILVLPFSRSKPLTFGVGGMSSSFDIFLELLLPFFTLLGNSDLRGVRTVATRFADLLIVSLIVHSLFFAM